ncbi:hypothetical protein KTH93_11485 [Acinetobacter bereziniae]|uniref:hypothetical protein n=1 Tax=Acinetobacter bereziniae TaxID=106648 RepID=UPI0021D2B80B|nr:hypothetical protein [Acinetobacter bereziniae]MCU4436090.1 hypothetical protein [Acinetobacter bereziniae]
MSYNIQDEQFTSNHQLYSLLSKATKEEALQLTRIVKDDNKEPYKHSEQLAFNTLCHEITLAGGNSFANVLRSQGNSYWDILDDVAKLVLKKKDFKRYSQIKDYDNVSFFDKEVSNHAKQRYIKAKKIDFSQYADPKQEELNLLQILENDPKKYINYIPQSNQLFCDHFNKHCLELEERILFELLEIKYSSLSEEKKREFDQAVQEIAIEKGLTSSKLSKGVGGLIVIGEMGGFTTYMLMSIFLSKIGMGVFGFGVFTGASTLLGVILGPVGWMASGSWILWEFASPRKNKMAKIVATVALIRLRLQEEENAIRVRNEQLKNEQLKKEKLESEQRLLKIRHMLKHPKESPSISYQHLKNKKNKKGRKKF